MFRGGDILNDVIGLWLCCGFLFEGGLVWLWCVGMWLLDCMEVGWFYFCSRCGRMRDEIWFMRFALIFRSLRLRMLKYSAAGIFGAMMVRMVCSWC